MATRWYNLQEILAEVAHDGDLSEFEDGTDESETESELESENSKNSADEASNFVQLMANQSFRKKIGRAFSLPESEIDSLRLNGKSHELSYKEKRLDCVVCAEVVRVNSLDRNQRNKSHIYCVTCGNKPLCINSNRNCWQKWHSLRQYWR